MTILSPNQAANVAKHVYDVRTNSDMSDVAETTKGIIADNFDISGASHMSGGSGPMIIRQRSGFGYAAHGKGKHQGEVLIALRGTVTGRDWLSNINIGLQQGPGGWPVHAGFHEIYKTFSTDLQNFLKNRSPSTVHCVGHSLGGALATLTADMLSENSTADVKLYTFGQPRTGVSGFSRNLTRKLTADDVYRVLHSADPVPMIPVFPFSHAPHPGKECLIQWSGGRISLDAHGMENYVKSVKDQGWSSLRNPPLTVDWEQRAEDWLKSASGYGVVPLSAWGLWMITKALWWIMKKVLTGVIGTALTLTATMLDQLAYLLYTGAAASKQIAGYIKSLIVRIFEWLGRKVVSTTISITATFVRWVLQLLIDTVATVARRALYSLPS